MSLRGRRLLMSCASAISVAIPRALASTDPTDVIAMPAWEIAVRIFVAAVLLCFSALFSGLTLGVMGLDKSSLHVIMESGGEVERDQAKRIMAVRTDGNLLLVTLLLGNVAVNSLISILTAELTSGAVGFALSTVLIVMLGEVLPQAACSRHGLALGAKFVPLVRVIVALLFPISKPIALGLDYWLGEEIGTYFSRPELSALVRMHASRQLLEPSEAAMMSGALSYKDKPVKSVMTPVADVFAVHAADRLDYALVSRIFRTGFSRVPVWEDERHAAVVGMLYAKDLMLISPTAGVPVLAIVHFFARQRVNLVDESDTLASLLRTFSSTRQQIAVVRAAEAHGEFDPSYRVSGIVTLEDIIEALIGQEIEDEYDSAQRRLEFTNAATAASERAEREQAALDTMNQVMHLPAAPGRGVNNALSVSEVRSISAFLLSALPAFKTRGGAPRYSLHAVGELVAASAVVEFIGLAHGGLSGASQEGDDGSPPNPASSATTRRSSASAASLDHGDQPEPSGASALLPPALAGAHPLSEAATPNDCAPLPAFSGLASGSAPNAAMIFERGVNTTHCLLILQGRVRCLCGNDGVTADKGPWDLLAESAVRIPAAGAGFGGGAAAVALPSGYAPDFLAFAMSPRVRCLRITVEDVEKYCVHGASAASCASSSHCPESQGISLLPKERRPAAAAAAAAAGPPGASQPPASTPLDSRSNEASLSPPAVQPGIGATLSRAKSLLSTSSSTQDSRQRDRDMRDARGGRGDARFQRVHLLTGVDLDTSDFSTLVEPQQQRPEGPVAGAHDDVP